MTSGQSHNWMSKITDVEVSAFSECFLFSFVFMVKLDRIVCKLSHLSLAIALVKLVKLSLIDWLYRVLICWLICWSFIYQLSGQINSYGPEKYPYHSGTKCDKVQSLLLMYIKVQSERERSYWDASAKLSWHSRGSESSLGTKYVHL